MISYARRRAESMRILSIDRFFDVVGGKERYVAEWAALMREHGHTVHLFATRPPGAPETPGTKFLPPAIETNARGPLRRMGEAARRRYKVQARDMQARMLDGQLDECDLTISELARVKASFAKTLLSMMHTRIKYTKETTVSHPATSRGEPVRAKSKDEAVIQAMADVELAPVPMAAKRRVSKKPPPASAA